MNDPICAKCKYVIKMKDTKAGTIEMSDFYWECLKHIVPNFVTGIPGYRKCYDGDKGSLFHDIGFCAFIIF